MPTANVYIGAMQAVHRDAVYLDKVTRDLTFTDESAKQQAEFSYKRVAESTFLVRLYRLDGDWLYVPRGYNLEPAAKAGVELAFEHDESMPSWPSEQWLVHRALRPAQKAPFEALLKRIGDKLLCLGCGKGKTTLALCYAAQKGVRTLVVVDRDIILEQWLREAKAVLDLDPEHIGRVQGAKHDTVGEQLTLATIHTLRTKPPEFFDQFGLAVFDEAHVMSAPTFFSVIPNIKGERLMLTATPARKDKLHPMFMLHGGGMMPVYTDTRSDLPAHWYFVRVPRLVPEALERGCYQRRPGYDRPVLSRPKFDTLTCQSPTFVNLVLDYVTQAARRDRQVLVLGPRTEMLWELSRRLEQHMPESSAVITGSVTKNRNDLLTRQVLFMTDSIASKALDVPRLDTLFLLFPNSDEGFLRQAVGRISRQFGDKRQPLVMVFTHDYVKSLSRKAGDMAEAVRRIDPSGTVRFVVAS